MSCHDISHHLRPSVFVGSMVANSPLPHDLFMVNGVATFILKGYCHLFLTYVPRYLYIMWVSVFELKVVLNFIKFSEINIVMTPGKTKVNALR